MKRRQSKRSGAAKPIELLPADPIIEGCIPSGCTLLDCVLGGGYAKGRVVNIVGDRSTGKTLLAIEAACNFALKFDAPIWYVETEAAFDQAYAAKLGLPLDRIDFVEGVFTVEDWARDFGARCKEGKPGLYILDSMDALSDQAELEREVGKGTYGMGKAKQTSELFRRLVKPMNTAGITLMVVSQLRDKIGVMFGEKHSRTGGRALDFYASHIVWLSQLKQLKKQRRKVERVVGIQVKALCKKNKLGPPYRDCTFPLIFNYGVDDAKACEDWLKDNGFTDLIDEPEHLPEVVRAAWAELEELFEPERGKYA